jgi:hypothetical protein
MSKSIRALLILILLLGGCTPVKEEPDELEVVFADPIGKEVTSPVSIPYVLINPITINTVTVAETDMTYASRIEIDGLKDPTVEDKINTAIQNRFDTLMSYQDFTKLPPFRGIRQKIKDNAVLSNFNLYASVSYNANNVLGICFNMYLALNNPDGTQAYVNVTDGMVFELIHGNTLNLSDVFTNDADISKLVNDSVSDSLRELNSQDENPSDYFWYGHLMQIAPFTGIKADQPFFISDQGLHLIIDYRTPVFETQQSSYSITVPFYDFLNFIGITERFVSNTEIYTKPIIDREFLFLGTDQEVLSIEDLGTSSSNFRFRISYPKDLDPAYVTLMNTVKESAKKELTDYMATHTVNYLNGAITVTQIGPYTCIQGSGEAYAGDLFTFVDQYACYDKAKQLVTISDFFKPGFDYETRIKQLIQKEIDVGYLPNDISIDEIYASLKIRLHNTGFYISGEGYSPSLGQKQYLGMTPAFSQFGAENLALFD